MDLKRIETFLNALLRRRENSPEFVKELNEYVSNLKNGTWAPSDANYIEALAKRLNISLKADGNTRADQVTQGGIDPISFRVRPENVAELKSALIKLKGYGGPGGWEIIDEGADVFRLELKDRDGAPAMLIVKFVVSE